MTAPNTADKQAETYTTRPTSQLDLEARREAGYLPASQAVDPNEVPDGYKVEDNDTSAYIGVSPEYMTYANEGEKPYTGEGVEAEVTEELLGGFSYGEDPAVEGEQTLGSGSSVPSVFVTTSGSNVEHEVVDREALNSATKDAEAKVADKPSATPPSVVKADEAPAPKAPSAPAVK